MNSGRLWRTGIWLLALMLLGTVLGLSTIGRESLWFDEAVSFLTARLPLSAILTNAVQSSHPPLYYLLLSGWLGLVPPTDAAARLLSLVFYVLLVPTLYGLVLELFHDRQAALLASGLSVVSPFHLLYSQELRMYTLLMLLMTVATWIYLTMRRTGRWLW